MYRVLKRSTFIMSCTISGVISVIWFGSVLVCTSAEEVLVNSQSLTNSTVFKGRRLEDILRIIPITTSYEDIRIRAECVAYCHSAAGCNIAVYDYSHEDRPDCYTAGVKFSSQNVEFHCDGDFETLQDILSGISSGEQYKADIYYISATSTHYAESNNCSRCNHMCLLTETGGPKCVADYRGHENHILAYGSTYIQNTRQELAYSTSITGDTLTATKIYEASLIRVHYQFTLPTYETLFEFRYTANFNLPTPLPGLLSGKVYRCKAYNRFGITRDNNDTKDMFYAVHEKRGVYSCSGSFIMFKNAKTRNFDETVMNFNPTPSYSDARRYSPYISAYVNIPFEHTNFYMLEELHQPHISGDTDTGPFPDLSSVPEFNQDMLIKAATDDRSYFNFTTYKKMSNDSMIWLEMMFNTQFYYMYRHKDINIELRLTLKVSWTTDSGSQESQCDGLLDGGPVAVVKFSSAETVFHDVFHTHSVSFYCLDLPAEILTFELSLTRNYHTAPNTLGLRNLEVRIYNTPIITLSVSEINPGVSPTVPDYDYALNCNSKLYPAGKASSNYQMFQISPNTTTTETTVNQSISSVELGNFTLNSTDSDHGNIGFVFSCHISISTTHITKLNITDYLEDFCRIQADLVGGYNNCSVIIGKGYNSEIHNSTYPLTVRGICPKTPNGQYSMKVSLITNHGMTCGFYLEDVLAHLLMWQSHAILSV